MVYMHGHAFNLLHSSILELFNFVVPIFGEKNNVLNIGISSFICQCHRTHLQTPYALTAANDDIAKVVPTNSGADSSR